LYGNVREFGDAGGSLGKRCLFFFTVFYPEIRLSGDRVKWRVKHGGKLVVYTTDSSAGAVAISNFVRPTMPKNGIPTNS